MPSKTDLSILRNDEVRGRTSAATLRVLEQRAFPESRSSRFLSSEHYTLLEEIVCAVLPQSATGTHVDIADAIDRRLESGTNNGWRYAVLPPDPEAYRQGLTVFHHMLQQTPMKTFAAMPTPAKEGYLRCVSNGDVDGPADFPLALWLKVVKAEIIRTWVAHPDGMRAMEYFGFADGATGNEGWVSIGPNTAAPFEYEGQGDMRGTFVLQQEQIATGGAK